MEMVLNNGFCEMSQEEVVDIEGGVGPVIAFLGKAAFTGICWGLGYIAMDKILE